MGRSATRKQADCGPLVWVSRMLSYIKVIVGIYWSYGGVSKPCAQWPARTSLCYMPLKRGACYIPLVARCRAAIKDLEYSWC